MANPFNFDSSLRWPFGSALRGVVLLWSAALLPGCQGGGDPDDAQGGVDEPQPERPEPSAEDELPDGPDDPDGEPGKDDGDDEPGDDDDGDDGPGEPDEPGYDGPRTAFVHLFEWSWDDVARECEQVLGPAGFAAVQVSPPSEHKMLSDHPWWVRYQPVSYALESRSGTAEQFEQMVQRCADAGVGIYVDAVINHMAVGNGEPGWNGTVYSSYDYPGLYGDQDFHDCRHGIDWSSQWEIQHCELVGLPDLDTGSGYVQGQLIGYLTGLSELGVAGFRIDAAKHIAAEELSAILEPLPESSYVFQEVIADGVISTQMYAGMGDVTEMAYSRMIDEVFSGGQLAWLDDFGSAWGLMPSEQAVVFVDNHDSQRGHGGAAGHLSHQRPELYRLANVFMLAWPYGYPKVMSSYAFGDGDQGPPVDGSGRVLSVEDGSGACVGGWICEHRWPAILAMVEFRNRTDGAPVTHWWDDGDQLIAFGRDGRGFVVINRHDGLVGSQWLDTGMAPGSYCDVVSGGVLEDGLGCEGKIVVVEEDGRALVEVDALDAVAIHEGSAV